MTDGQSADFFMVRHPHLAVAGYVVLVAVLIAITGYAVIGIHDRYATLTASASLLDQLGGRTAPTARTAAGPDHAQTPSGSPFLEGDTVTVAGATLMQRVVGAVTSVGGQVLSSQVDLQGARAKKDFVSVVANCEVDQPALQRLLYDIEAGMPYLFVDQLVAQSPEGGLRDGRRLRVMLGVSGQWRGAR